VRIVEVKLEDESSSPFVAKGDESAPTADQPVVLKEHVPKKSMRAKAGSSPFDGIPTR
jgi:hypothetical protein